MSTLFLVRHGETDWNRSGQIMGERPVPLNRHGVAQAQRLAESLQGRPIEALYSSPVARALQTADILSSALFVSHADVLRAILAHYLRIDLQTARQMRIDHASLTALDINGTVTDLLFLNLTADTRDPR
ncbi:MAG: histidine phosphatase family protein [Nitrospirae bacterium]|nr:MAG: histidine phosphatase family protein [Nitrospirota bacterium]